MTAPAGDRITASVSVRRPRQLTFDLFTQEIDRWSRRGPRYRNATDDRALIHIEPFVGGRVVESSQGDGEERAFEIGRVTRWDPPTALSFSWRNSVFMKGEITAVDVRFDDHGDSTMVTVTHGGWADIPEDHPARHGHSVTGFQRMIGTWWADQLTELRRAAEG